MTISTEKEDILNLLETAMDEIYNGGTAEPETHRKAHLFNALTAIQCAKNELEFCLREEGTEEEK